MLDFRIVFAMSSAKTPIALKTRLLKYIAPLIFIACFNNYCLGQEYYDAVNSTRQYYYNNLESATTGTASPATYFPTGASSQGTTAAIKLVSASSLNSTKSFSTVGGSTLGTLTWNFLGNSGSGSGTSLNGAPWEWEFDYKNTTGGSTVDPEAGPSGMVAGNDSWRYWLISSFSGTTRLGIYVTQVGGNLVGRQKYDGSTNTRALWSVPMANNTHTYQVRIERAVTGYYNVFVLDRTLGTVQSSLNINANYDSAYNLSYLDATSASADRFQWDNFNFYQVKLDYLPVTGNGVSNPIYPGMGTAILYGINLSARGDIVMGRFVMKYNADISKLVGINVPGYLYETGTLPLSTTGLSPIKNYTLYNNGGTSQEDLSGLNLHYYSSGNTNGTTSHVTYYFLTAAVMSSFTSGYPTTVSYSVSTDNNDNYSQFFNSSSPFSSASASSVSTPSNNGDVWDWTGSKTNWTDVGAWKKNAASTSTATGPGISTDIVRIGVEKYSGGTNQPPIGSATPNVGTIEFGQYGSNSASPSAITLDLGAKTVTVNTGITLDASANVIITGATNSKLILNTGTKSTVASTAVLTVASNLTLQNDGTITLQSDASGTASIATIPTTSTINGAGTVIAQRYIPGGSALTTRKYRLLSSPVNQYTGNQYDFQNLKLNSLITGAAGKGFDVSALNNPSLYLYTEATAAYPGVTAITQKANVGTGFYFYFRGDRTDPGTNGDKYVKPYKDPENTTETWIGTINSGTIVVPITYTARYSAPNVYNTSNGFNLVGNPYPSAIDLEAITLSANCSKIIYEYNYRTGNFDTYDITNHTASTGDLSLRYIASGQGFFVKMNDPAVKPAAGTVSNGTVTFTESAKSTTNNTSTHLLMGPKPKDDIIPVIRVKLEMDSANADNTAIFFRDGYADTYDNNDAIRFNSIETKVSLASLSSDRQNLAMNFMPTVSDVKRVALSVGTTTTGLYTFRFANTETIDSRYAIWLKDKYKKDSLDLRNNSSYAFNIDRADTSSFGNNRFEIVFHEDIPTYTLRSFTAVKSNVGAKLTWVTSNEADYTGFTLEKQDSNHEFQAIYSVQSDGRGTYDFTDTQLNSGDNYYRLKQNDADSKISYSKTVDLTNNSNTTVKNSFIIYPTPATTIIHTSSATIKEACKMMIFNANGAKLLDKNVDNGGDASQYIGNYLPGTYIVQLVSLKDNKVLGVTKFAKN